LDKVRFKVSTSLYPDETASVCNLVIPNLHALERWDDARPRAGIRSLMQPVMEPVFKNVATGDVLLQVARKLGGAIAAAFPAPTFEAHLRTAWEGIARGAGAGDAGAFWRAALARGGVYDAAPAPAAVRLASTAADLNV